MREMSQADIVVFWKITEGFLCQSPGGLASTTRAFEMLPPLAKGARILDGGCGPGRQTFDLAALCDAHITAVDPLPSFIEQLRERAEALGLAARIDARVGNMVEVEPPEGGFDLIWCEGAVYNVGFEHALRTWRRWLAPGGCIGVSELGWLGEERPAAAAEFWGREYPPMQSHDENLQTIEACGYELLGTFPLPWEDWDRYYGQRDERIESLRAGETDPEMLRALDESAAEAELYRNSNGAFNYIFYVVRPTHPTRPTG